MNTIKAYIALTKPRVIELLLVATIPAMLQAHRGSFDLALILLTLFGGWMGAAAANSFNMIVDSDIDKVMKRTMKRPLAESSIPVSHARIFAWILTVASFLWLWLICKSLLAGIFVLFTIAFYIFIYTKWLKRKTWQNVIWGGVAGCMPIMVGWAVVTDNNDGAFNAGWQSWIQAIILFLVIFFWTPPHTWALGMKYKDDYAAAGVPMMPVVKPPRTVANHILLYTLLTVITSFLLIPAAGWLYALSALILGIWFITSAYSLQQSVYSGKAIKPIKLFILSNNYLALLFLALSADALINLPVIASLVG